MAGRFMGLNSQSLFRESEDDQGLRSLISHDIWKFTIRLV